MYQILEVNSKMHVATSARPLTVNYRMLVTRLSCYGLDETAGQQFDLLLGNTRQGVEMKFHTHQIDQF